MSLLNLNLSVAKDAYTALQEYLRENEGNFQQLVDFKYKNNVFFTNEIVDNSLFKLEFKYNNEDVYDVDADITNGSWGYEPFVAMEIYYSFETLFRKVTQDSDESKIDIGKVINDVEEKVYVLQELCEMSTSKANTFLYLLNTIDRKDFERATILYEEAKKDDDLLLYL